MTDLERRALLGDKQAREECTRNDIVLPCHNYVTACGDCNDISAIKAAEGINFASQAHIPRDQWQDAAEVME